jgi:hypothetical protein
MLSRSKTKLVRLTGGMFPGSSRDRSRDETHAPTTRIREQSDLSLGAVCIRSIEKLFSERAVHGIVTLTVALEV